MLSNLPHDVESPPHSRDLAIDTLTASHDGIGDPRSRYSPINSQTPKPPAYPDRFTDGQPGSSI
jgi:hypothetical protein